jgi:pectin methylesterase-like acyl-CoA thioesterase
MGLRIYISFLFIFIAVASLGQGLSKPPFDFVVAQDGSGDFTTIQEAFDASPDSFTIRITIFIKKGVYKEKLVLAKSKSNISIFGEDANETIITYDDNARKINPETGKEFGTFASRSFYVGGEDFYAQDITFENSSGPVGQALAIFIEGDKAIFNNCRFLGYQDTVYGDKGRQYFKNCNIEGSTDFIFGPSIAVFDQSTIHSIRGNYITAASTPEGNEFGYVFLNCKLTAEKDVKAYLGRPWRDYAKVVFIDCEIGDHIRPEGWHNWNKPHAEKTVLYAEHNNTGPGADISKRVAWSRQLTQIEASKYTVFGILQGTDGWDPDILLKRYSIKPKSKITATIEAKNTTLAFPGAEGFGKHTVGGRGGKVIYVTNLNDSGPGSLREAIKANGARTVLFKVSGTIELKSVLEIKNDSITIAGQSAPGDGICISNYPVTIKANEVIIRFMRFRMGDLAKQQSDALSAIGRKNIIIDHCSMSWGIDECATFYDNENFTLQWCIISESLNNSVHVKGRHGYGGIWGGMGATFHHNLLAHHTSRNPRLCGSRYHKQPEKEIADLRNNVIYNWQHNNIYGGEKGNYNIVANYLKPGPATQQNRKWQIFEPYEPFGQFFIAENHLEGHKAISLDNWDGGIRTHLTEQIKLNTPVSFVSIMQRSAEEAYHLVLNYAGASLKRDVLDLRIVEEVKSGTAKYGVEKDGIIDSQVQVGGWPLLESKPAPKDSDGDGMPDEWEVAQGLNPNDPTDGRLPTLDSSYTNLEVYLNSLVPIKNIIDL